MIAHCSIMSRDGWVAFHMPCDNFSSRWKIARLLARKEQEMRAHVWFGRLEYTKLNTGGVGIWFFHLWLSDLRNPKHGDCATATAGLFQARETDTKMKSPRSQCSLSFWVGRTEIHQHKMFWLLPVYARLVPIFLAFSASFAYEMSYFEGHTLTCIKVCY